MKEAAHLQQRGYARQHQHVAAAQQREGRGAAALAAPLDELHLGACEARGVGLAAMGAACPASPGLPPVRNHQAMCHQPAHRNIQLFQSKIYAPKPTPPQ
jgi:hypothetical protein